MSWFPVNNKIEINNCCPFSANTLKTCQMGTQGTIFTQDAKKFAKWGHAMGRIGNIFHFLVASKAFSKTPGLSSRNKTHHN